MKTEPALAPPPGNPRFPHLDGFRGLTAVGAVLAVHALEPGIASSATPAWVHGVFTLRIFVAFFFLMSGFLLYRPFVAARLRGKPRPSARVFWWRRILRVFPGYWVALTLLAIWPGLPGVFSSHGWAYYGLVYTYSPNTVTGGLVPAWTLCCDVAFYLVLPFYAVALDRVWSRLGGERGLRAELGVMGGIWLIATVYWFALLHSSHLAPATEQVRTTNLLANFDWIVMGMGLALLSVVDRSRVTAPTRMLSRRYAVELAWGGAAVGFAVLAAVIFDVSPAVQHVLAGLICLAIFAPAVLVGHRGGILKVLTNPFIAWLGLVSYGVYLYHGPLIAELYKRGVVSGKGPVAYVELYLAGAIVATIAGAISYYGVERVFLRHKRTAASPARSAPQVPGSAVAAQAD